MVIGCVNMNKYDNEVRPLFAEKYDKDTREIICDFSILWNIYESECFYDDVDENNRRVPIFSEIKHERILDFINNKINNNPSLKHTYIEEINFIYEKLVRYLEKNIVYINNYKSVCDYFHITDPHGIKEVREIIKREELDYFDKFHLLLVITFRVRNNMFHGTKETNSLNSEKDLFLICNNTMLLAINDVKKYIR